MQTISGIALGLFVSVAIFCVSTMIAARLLFWVDASVHPMWISAPSGVAGLIAVTLCLKLRENILGFERAEAWSQRVIVALFVIPVQGAITWWCGTEFPF